MFDPALATSSSVPADAGRFVAAGVFAATRVNAVVVAPPGAVPIVGGATGIDVVRIEGKKQFECDVGDF